MCKLYAFSYSGLLLLHACIQGNTVPCRVREVGEPAHVRDFSLRLQRFAACSFNFSKRGIDVVGSDVNQYFALLVIAHSAYLDKTSTGTRIRLEHVIIECGVMLDVPAEGFCIELAGCRRILRRNLNVDNRMVWHNGTCLSV